MATPYLTPPPGGDPRARLAVVFGQLMGLRRERAAARYAWARGDRYGPDYGDAALIEYGEALTTMADLSAAMDTPP